MGRGGDRGQSSLWACGGGPGRELLLSGLADSPVASTLGGSPISPPPGSQGQPVAASCRPFWSPAKGATGFFGTQHEARAPAQCPRGGAGHFGFLGQIVARHTASFACMRHCMKEGALGVTYLQGVTIRSLTHSAQGQVLRCPRWWRLQAGRPASEHEKGGDTQVLRDGGAPRGTQPRVCAHACVHVCVSCYFRNSMVHAACEVQALISRDS